MTRSILFVYAHPDDESHWGAGIAARYHDEGTRTVLVTATRGERGTTGDLCSVDELPRVREQELREAVRILQFDELHLLPYQDKQLASAPPDEIRRTLVTIVRRERPPVVVTFDPNGFNLHTDHLAISRFTSDAVSAAADPRWSPDLGPSHAVRRLLWIPTLEPWQDDDFTSLPGVDFLIDTAKWWQHRARALAAHRTQHVLLNKLYLQRPDVERILGFDVLRHAWGPPLARRPADDLFVGCEDG
jgi:LmbE family N-acetylglucosaminyl deacetylase